MMQKMLLLLGVVVFAGCEIPATRIGADAKNIYKLSQELRSVDNKGEHSQALRLAAELEEEALSFCRDAKAGDPRRQKADEALLLAREVRARIARTKKSELKELAANTQKEEFNAVLLNAENNGEKINELVMDFKLASSDTESVEDEESSSYGGQIRDGLKIGGTGDNLDFDNKPSSTRTNTSNKRDLSKITKTFSILGMESRDNAVIFHVLVVSKNRSVRIGAIQGNAMAHGKKAGRILVTYEKKGFKPNWKSITDSKGVTLEMESHAVEAGKYLELICVAEKTPKEKITSAKLELMLSDGNIYRASGSGR